MMLQRPLKPTILQNLLQIYQHICSSEFNFILGRSISAPERETIFTTSSTTYSPPNMHLHFSRLIFNMNSWEFVSNLENEKPAYICLRIIYKQSMRRQTNRFRLGDFQDLLLIVPQVIGDPVQELFHISYYRFMFSISTSTP